MDIEEMRFQLSARLKKNHADFHNGLADMSHSELIENAGRIAKTKEVFEYLLRYNGTEQELAYLLQFQNPLEVVTDCWEDCVFELDALGAVVKDAANHELGLDDYPLVSDALGKEPEGLRKFLNVNLKKILPQIMAQQTAYDQSSLTRALNHMRRFGAKSNPGEQRYVVIFGRHQIDFLNEREAFVQGTSSFRALQAYHAQTDAPVLAYAVELTGDGRRYMRGHLYQLDPYQLALTASRAAVSRTDVTLTFSDGETMRVPDTPYARERAVDYDRWIVNEHSEVENEDALRSVLQQEHEKRTMLPPGNIATHLRQLRTQRIQAEADRIIAELQGITMPNGQDRKHFEVEVSPWFLKLSTDSDKTQLFEQIAKKMGPSMGSVYLDGASGRCVFLHQKGAVQKRARKPSIKQQLAAKPVHGDRPTEKEKDMSREAR